MSARPASLTLTVPRESFAFSGSTTRSTEPEVFTFERLHAPAATAVRSCVPVRPRKRATRVMYPAKVRMHLPPPERSQAKRWLLLLVLVVLWQVYTEEPWVDAEAAAGDYQTFPFQPAERIPSSEQISGCHDSRPDGEQLIPDSACLPLAKDADSSAFEQSAGKSYMVALLVYHRLGNDN